MPRVLAAGHFSVHRRRAFYISQGPNKILLTEEASTLKMNSHKGDGCVLHRNGANLHAGGVSTMAPNPSVSYMMPITWQSLSAGGEQASSAGGRRTSSHSSTNGVDLPDVEKRSTDSQPKSEDHGHPPSGKAHVNRCRVFVCRCVKHCDCARRDRPRRCAASVVCCAVTSSPVPSRDTLDVLQATHKVAQIF